MLHLVSNDQSYQHALLKAWQDSEKFDLAPVKSSFCKYRKKISFRFFEDKFNKLLKSANSFRKKFRGFYIYAIDGQETAIPLSQSILSCGYKGRARAKNMETHFPRLYMSHLFDVVNEMTTKVIIKPVRREAPDAVELLKNTEKNSIVLYDRAYMCKNLLETHKTMGNFFIIRCRSGATFLEIKNFYQSKKKSAIWKHNGQKIRLIRIRNPRTREDMVLATNLPISIFTDSEIGQIYNRRWGIETAFKDSVNQRLGNWHSKDVNGLLQELYMRLWLINLARVQILAETLNSPKRWLLEEYRKPNLKLVLKFIVENIPLILRKKFREVINILNKIIQVTIQKRQHLSRTYPRVLKSSRRTFFVINLVRRRCA